MRTKRGVDPIQKNEADIKEKLPHETQSAQNRYILSEFRIPIGGIGGIKRGEYKQLHETLDVSVFR